MIQLTLAPSFPAVPSDPFSPIVPCRKQPGVINHYYLKASTQKLAAWSLVTHSSDSDKD